MRSIRWRPQDLDLELATYGGFVQAMGTFSNRNRLAAPDSPLDAVLRNRRQAGTPSAAGVDPADSSAATAVAGGGSARTGDMRRRMKDNRKGIIGGPANLVAEQAPLLSHRDDPMSSDDSSGSLPRPRPSTALGVGNVVLAPVPDAFDRRASDSQRPMHAAELSPLYTTRWIEMVARLQPVEDIVHR